MTLSCSTGTWTGTAPISYFYQWHRNGFPLPTTTSNYPTVAADAGTAITCWVSAVNDASPGGVSVRSSNEVTVTAAPGTPQNTALPQITGNTLVNSELLCSTGTWTGTAPISYFYQWHRNGFPLPTTTSNYFTVTDDIGTEITCWVSAVNTVSPGGIPVRSFNAVTVMAPAVAPENQALPQVSGASGVGSSLFCSTGTWTGTAPINYAYRWRRGANNIAGTLGAANPYITIAADIGEEITCRVTATNTALPGGVAVISQTRSP